MLSSPNLSDAITFMLDPDVYSLRGEVQPWVEGQDIQLEEIRDPESSDTASVTLGEDLVETLNQCKSPQGLVRDARSIESRLRPLYLTRDNAQTLLQGFENPNTATGFVRSILATLSRRCVVLKNEDVLNAVKDKRTGNVRPRNPLSQQIPKIYAQFRVSYFINHAWEQIRELTYLSVSDEAREILMECAKRNVVRRSRFTTPECPQKEIIRTVDGFLQRNVRQEFVAALTRRIFMTDMEKAPVVTLDESGSAREVMSLKTITKQDKDKNAPEFRCRKLYTPSSRNTVSANASPPSHFRACLFALTVRADPFGWAGKLETSSRRSIAILTKFWFTETF